MDAIATEAANQTVKPLTPAEGTFPMELAPGASTRFRVTPSSGIDISGLDLSEVETVPNEHVIYEKILEPGTSASFKRPINVKMFAPTFASPPDAPDQQVVEVLVEFDDGSGVALTATELEKTVAVIRLSPAWCSRIHLPRNIATDCKWHVRTGQ